MVSTQGRDLQYLHHSSVKPPDIKPPNTIQYNTIQYSTYHAGRLRTIFYRLQIPVVSSTGTILPDTMCMLRTYNILCANGEASHSKNPTAQLHKSTRLSYKKTNKPTIFSLGYLAGIRLGVRPRTNQAVQLMCLLTIPSITAYLPTRYLVISYTIWHNCTGTRNSTFWLSFKLFFVCGNSALILAALPNWNWSNQRFWS